MTSSTKLEVLNILYCYQRRTETLLQVTCTENVMKFGHVIYEICQWTDRQTHRHAHRNTSHLSWGRTNKL